MMQIGEKKDGSLRNTFLNNFFLYTVIFSIFLAILITEKSFNRNFLKAILFIDDLVGVIFIIEYLLRIWVSPLNGKYRNEIQAIIKFIFSPKAIIDLIVIVPFIFEITGHHILLSFRLLRILRFFRINQPCLIFR